MQTNPGQSAAPSAANPPAPAAAQLTATVQSAGAAQNLPVQQPPLSGNVQFVLAGIVIAAIGFYSVILNKVIGRLRRGRTALRTVGKLLWIAILGLVGVYGAILLRIFLSFYGKWESAAFDQLIVELFLVVNLFFIAVFLASYLNSEALKSIWDPSYRVPADPADSKKCCCHQPDNGAPRMPEAPKAQAETVKAANSEPAAAKPVGK